MVAKCPQTEKKIPLQRVYFGLFRGVISVKCAHKCTNYKRTVSMWKSICSRKSVLFQIDLRTVPTIVIAHTFCASPDTRISYLQCLLIQGYFCAA